MGREREYVYVHVLVVCARQPCEASGIAPRRQLVWSTVSACSCPQRWLAGQNDMEMCITYAAPLDTAPTSIDEVGAVRKGAYNRIKVPCLDTKHFLGACLRLCMNRHGDSPLELQKK